MKSQVFLKYFFCILLFLFLAKNGFSATCTGSPHACSAYNASEANCTAAGCTPSYCTGTSHSCTAHGYGDCPAGCSANLITDCAGVWYCEQITVVDSCMAVIGAGAPCWWTGAACQNTGGSWDPVDCSGATTSGNCSGLDGLTGGGNCSWVDSSDCTDGTHPACSNYTSDSGTCTGHGCSWAYNGTCGGSHNACTTYSDSSTCTTHVCTWFRRVIIID